MGTIVVARASSFVASDDVMEERLVTDPTEPPVNAETAALRTSAATRTDARKLSAPDQNCACSLVEHRGTDGAVRQNEC